MIDSDVGPFAADVSPDGIGKQPEAGVLAHASIGTIHKGVACRQGQRLNTWFSGGNAALRGRCRKEQTVCAFEAFLSPFLTGTSVFDPFSGQVRSLNDLARRNADLKGLVCSPAMALGTLRASGAGVTSIAKGIQRVH